MTYTISWDIGTDVNFRIYYSRETIASWNWQAEQHITSYKAMAVTITHTMKFFGNFTVYLNISNQVGQEIINITTMVEPDLNNITAITSFYQPKATPLEFMVQMNCSDLSKLDAPIIVWCSFNYDDDNSTENLVANAFGTITSKSLLFNHTYMTDKPGAKPYMTCWNHVSHKNYSTILILREVIMGLNITPDATEWPTLKPLQFNIGLSSGSHVIYNVTFGDGSTQSYVDSNRLSSEEIFTFEKTYTVPGIYQIGVVAFNEHFNSTFSSTYNITVQNPVGELDFQGNTLVPFPTGTNTYTITCPSCSRFPTDVFSKFELNDTKIDEQFCPNTTKGLAHNSLIQFNRSYIGHNVSFGIISYNLISSQVYETHAFIIEIIENLNVTVSLQTVVPHQNIIFTITVSNGSNVHFQVNYGDGNNLDLDHPELLASKSNVSLQKAYSVIGNYTCQVQASNALSSRSFTVPHKIVVQNLINQINLTANTSVLYTPAEVDFFLSFNDQQLQLTDVHCTWTHGGKLPQYMFFPSLSAGQVYHQRKAFERSFIGNMTTFVNCSNLVSYSTANFTTEIILDAVILDSLVSNGSVFLTNTSGFILDIKRFGSKACFQWDMGDRKSKVMYGLPLCQAFANERGIPFIEVADQQMTIVHEYVYEATGEYNVVVDAFNHVSNDSLSTVGIVKEWYCLRPNISFPENITDPQKPPVFMRSQNISIPPILEVDCMLTDDIDFTWTIYRSDDKSGTPVFTQYQTPVFQTGPRAFPYGNFFVNLTIQMRKISNTNQTGGFYLRIIKTPLIVGMKGNNVDKISIDEDYTLNAIDATFDPDVEPSDKTGLDFTWSCRQINSSFDLTEINRAELTDDVLTVLDKPDGCFGEDPGIITEKAGVFKVKTGLLMPDSYYYISVRVKKDNRNGSAEKSIIVNPVAAPTVSVK